MIETIKMLLVLLTLEIIMFAAAAVMTILGCNAGAKICNAVFVILAIANSLIAYIICLCLLYILSM